ncbi:MAG: hypothetical protein KDI51_08755 [Xanthomonadales bacterium]|nr:hypothetical protein [Xanthomonadales bacterium]
MSLRNARRRVLLAREQLRLRQQGAMLEAAQLDSHWQRWKWPVLLAGVGLAGWRAAGRSADSEADRADCDCAEAPRSRPSTVLAWSSLLTQIAPVVLPWIEAQLEPSNHDPATSADASFSSPGEP